MLVLVGLRSQRREAGTVLGVLQSFAGAAGCILVEVEDVLREHHIGRVEEDPQIVLEAGSSAAEGAVDNLAEEEGSFQVEEHIAGVAVEVDRLGSRAVAADNYPEEDIVGSALQVADCSNLAVVVARSPGGEELKGISTCSP